MNLPADPELIDQAGSRQAIPTPAAVLDLDAFERNLAKMAARAEAAGLALRPHAKSHKCSALALRQIDGGAVGVCCAKLGEAEAMAMAGVASILVTSPIVGQLAAERAARLADELEDFRIVVDCVDGVRELAEAAAGPIQVLIDVDVGTGRTGVASPEQAAEVAQAILAEPNLELIGVQGYGGHWQHMEGANVRAAAVAEGMARLSAAIEAIRAVGGELDVVTGGGTGTFAADVAQGVLTEVQPGSYAFMDREYRDALHDDPDGGFEQSLFVAATVISDNQPKWVTVDAGLKAFAADGPPPVPADPALTGAKYRFFGDEHGMVTRPDGVELRRGRRIDFVPGHIDPTMDRYDLLHLVRGDALVGIVPIEGRGAGQ